MVFLETHCLYLSHIWILLVFYINLSSGQRPCEPMEEGPYLGTQPTLQMRLYETNKQELEQYPESGKYKDKLKIYGKTGATTSNEISLEILESSGIYDPSTVLKFETEASGVNIVRLIKPIDRDGPTPELNDDLNFLIFTLKCTVIANTTHQRFYTTRIQIIDVNDNYPQFQNAPYTITLNELTSVGITVETIKATDLDFNLDGNLSYSIIPNTGLPTDGSQYFDINNETGKLKLSKVLDYETLGQGQKYFTLRVQVMDGGPADMKANQTDIMIYVTDGNDLPVAFVYPGCFSHLNSCVWPKYTTLVSELKMHMMLTVYPVPNKISNYTQILARDQDLSLEAEIKFSIISTIPPGSENKFSIETIGDENTGLYTAEIYSIGELPNNLNGFEIFIKAEELTELKRFEVAMIYFIDDTKNTTSTNMTGGQVNKPNNTKPDKKPVVKPDEKPIEKPQSEYSTCVIGLIVCIIIVSTLFLISIITVLCFVKHYASRSQNYQLQSTPANSSHTATTPI